MEFAAFADVIGWAHNDYDYDVETVTCGFQKEVVSTFHIPVLVDQTIDEINEPIVVDRKVITSYCPQTASGVAFKLLELLTSKEQMEIVKEAMGF